MSKKKSYMESVHESIATASGPDMSGSDLPGQTAVPGTHGNPPVNKAEKLKELAAKRVPVAIRRIEMIGNLAAYKPTQEQSDKLIAYLEEAVHSASLRLHGNKGAQKDFSI